MNLLGFIQQTAFLGSLLYVMLATVAMVAWPLLQKYTRHLPAGHASDSVLVFALLPLAGTCLILGAALLPSLLELTGLSSDHCLGHESGHLHYCLVHLPPVIDSAFVWMAGSVLPVVIAGAGHRLAKDLSALKGVRHKLHSHVHSLVDDRVYLLETPLPLALACGVRDPAIYLSTGILESLDAEETGLIVAHERAHIRRCDALKKLLLRSICWAMPPGFRENLLQQYDRFSEQACDAQAAEGLHDRSKFAALLLKVESMYHSHFPARTAVVSSFEGGQPSSLPERIDVLLSDQSQAGRPWPLMPVLFAACLLLVVLDGAVHNSLEHLLSLLVSH